MKWSGSQGYVGTVVGDGNTLVFGIGKSMDEARGIGKFMDDGYDGLQYSHSKGGQY